MATYTIALREYIESFSNYQHYDNIHLSHADKIEEGRKRLFDFDYPIFDEAYKKTFETHFIRNFYMREIGFETMGLFKLQLETWLLINMPYYNKLFESELIEFDPLQNSEVKVTHNKTNDKTQKDNRDRDISTSETGKIDSSSNQTSNTSGSSVSNSDTNYTDNQTGSKDSNSERLNDKFDRELESTTPDSRLTITTNDGKGVIEYASSIEEKTEKDNETNKTNTTEKKDSSGNNKNKTDTTSNVDSDSKLTGNETSESDRNTKEKDSLLSDINEIEDFIQHRAGKIGVQTYSKMLQEYRETFMRIEKRIFDEMQELFMLLY